MELQTLARPYAKAVFALAQDSAARNRWSAVLDGLGAAVDSPDMFRLLGSPAVGRDQLADIVGDALTADQVGQAGADLPPEAQVRNFLRLLAHNRRLTLVPVIAREFEALRAQAEARVDVEIITAEAEVPQSQRDALEAAVAKRLDRTVKVIWQSDPELIGGAVIRAGDWVIDGSLRSELQRLSQDLMR